MEADNKVGKAFVLTQKLSPKTRGGGGVEPIDVEEELLSLRN